MYNLDTIISAAYNGRETEIPERMVCLDPGNTTGACLFVNGKLESWAQIVTIQEIPGDNGCKSQIAWDALREYFEETKPTLIVCENYRIYSHKLERHTFSEVPTLRLIGGIDLLAYQWGVPVHYQMAASAKGFANDERLKAWGLWQEGMRHSRDAIRHGIYYLITH